MSDGAVGSGAMRGREMHPLCCINIDCPLTGEGEECEAPRPATEDESGCAVAGVLHKWTNYGKGWRSRWFSLRSGVLSYSKARAPPEIDGDGGGVRLIGDRSASEIRRIEAAGGSGRGRRSGIGIGRKRTGVIHLKISSFRESRSDDRRFYIFSSTKTLHLKADSKKDRVAWIQALLSARNLFPCRSFNDHITFVSNDACFSTEKLRNRLHHEGVSETLIKDCEQIMLSECSQVKLIYDEQIRLLALHQFEGTNREHVIQDDQLLIKNGFSSSGRGKFSEYSTTESSDDIEKQELDEFSEDEETSYFDTEETFADSVVDCHPNLESSDNSEKIDQNAGHFFHPGSLSDKTEQKYHKLQHVERRKKLPDPIEKEKGVSLWSMIKDNVGKDLTRVCLPVYFNEPLSSLQKCFEEFEYSDLLDRAYAYGKMGNSVLRILNVASFAVSGYASSDGRHCKPFNPLLGESYEADYPERGIRFFSEKVSHHPTQIACHCEGMGWKFWGDSNLKSKFWGRSIQLDPVGILTLEFDDGEIFQWSKVTTSIYNLILGKIYCDHHGIMNIQGNREYSCKLRFKEQSIFDYNPRQVQGYVEDVKGNKVASLYGKWDDSIYYNIGDATYKAKADSMKDASLLWKRSNIPPNLTRYNLSLFAITLNELTSELQEKLPPTDSRRRPDQRHLENGEYEKANAEKLRLERRQRMSRKLQDSGWRPRWFEKDHEDGTFHYIGGYWEAREEKNWDGCPNIFGDILDDSDASVT